MEAMEASTGSGTGAARGGVRLPTPLVERMRAHFRSVSVSDEETLSTMRRTWARTTASGAGAEEAGVCLCPHSATAVHAAECLAAVLDASTAATTVVVLTAHPAKFEDAVQQAIGRPPPTLPVVEALRAVPAEEHRCTVLKRAPDPGWKEAWTRQLKKDVAESDATKAVHPRSPGASRAAAKL